MAQLGMRLSKVTFVEAVHVGGGQGSTAQISDTQGWDITADALGVYLKRGDIKLWIPLSNVKAGNVIDLAEHPPSMAELERLIGPLKCPECGRECATLAGLKAHQRCHGPLAILEPRDS